MYEIKTEQEASFIRWEDMVVDLNIHLILTDMDAISCSDNMENPIEFIIMSTCSIFTMFLFKFPDYII